MNTHEDPQAEDGEIFMVESYDDRFLRLWPTNEAEGWALDALGYERAGTPCVGTGALPPVQYVAFIPAKYIGATTPIGWWSVLFCPAGLECVVTSVDEQGAGVLGFGCD